MPARRRRVTALAAALSLVGSVALSACSGSAADAIAYAVDGSLVTYNTNTVVGAASAGPQAFARVLTGFDYHGPEGQVVGDRDFGTVMVVGRAPLVLDYQINDNAVFSDGKPVTCDDMVLAWAAQRGLPRFEGHRRGVEALGSEIVGKLSYYERWAVAFANILFQKGVLTPEDLAKRMREVERRLAAERGDSPGAGI